jgi:serine/threonine protein kinase
MQKRNYWTEELSKWLESQKEEEEDLKKFFAGQETLAEEARQAGSKELQTIIDTGQIEDYKILEEMGQGADARIYKARKEGQDYIIKVPLTDGESKTRLKNEMDISIKIKWLTPKKMENGWRQTPHIIQMHDCRKGDLTFAVLELLEKQIERTYKKTGKTIALAVPDNAANQGQHATRVALYAWDTLHALEFMHSMNIVHRDVKHQNAMATHRQGKLASVLFDLGTALDLTHEEAIRTAKITGTPAYLPKETVMDFWKYKENGGFYSNCPLNRAKLILKRGDYGALAHSIAHLLTGIPPYSCSNVEGEPTSVFDTCDTNIGFINTILNYPDNPINYDRIKAQGHGDMFVEVVKKLLDPMIVSRTEIDTVRSMLEEGMNMEGLFTKYRR